MFFLKVEEHKRIIIHEKYWKLEDYGRRLWIHNHVTTERPKRRYANEAGSKRKFSRYFFLLDTENKTNRISVCQTIFLRRLGVRIR